MFLLYFNILFWSDDKQGLILLAGNMFKNYN